MLKYTGGGYGGMLAHIPARDLNDEEVKELGGEEKLIKTGLYVRSKNHAPIKEIEVAPEKEVLNGR